MEKIERIGGIETSVYRGDSFQLLRDYLSSRKSGIVLLNENSMVDTARIDYKDNGLVGPQSVNLETMVGSGRVLGLVRIMMDNGGCTFLPGTLLRDFGGYCLPVMPVVKDGKLIMEKAKTTGLPYVDDYRKLAEKFFGKEYADSVASFSGVNWEEPLRSLVVKLISEVEQRRRGSYVPIDVNGLCVTPVICNELGDFVNQYEGRPIDIIAHSASNLFTQESDRASYYCERFEKLASRRKLNIPLVVALAEEREHGDGYTGLFCYNTGKLEQLNLKV